MGSIAWITIPLHAVCLNKWSDSQCIHVIHIHSPSGVFEFKVAEFSAQEEDADIDDDPVLDQGTDD